MLSTYKVYLSNSRDIRELSELSSFVSNEIICLHQVVLDISNYNA